MAKNRTEKCPYQSRYSDSFVRPDQYILELICEKKARCEGKDLPRKFWNQKEWSAFFRRYLRQVQKLLKTYDHRAVVQAYKNPESGWRWSPFTPEMDRLIAKEHETLMIARAKREEIRKKGESVEVNRDTISSKPRERRKGAVDKLLDNLD